MKPARKAISTLRGEGTWGTTGGREQVGGQGPGGLLTIPPRITGAPDLACKMRQRHAARVQTAQRRDTHRPHGRETEDIEIINGHTAETPNTTESLRASVPSGISLRIPSGLRAFWDLPSGLRALRVYMGVGMCCVEGSSARRGY